MPIPEGREAVYRRGAQARQRAASRDDLAARSASPI